MLLAYLAAMGKCAAALRWAIWPRRCSGCDAVAAPNDVLGACMACRRSFFVNLGPRCRACDAPTKPAGGSGCSCLLRDPQGSALLASCRAVYLYDAALAACIVRGKYGGLRHTFTGLGALMAQDAATRRLCHSYHALVPIPSTARRLRQRGFAPSTLLAHALSQAGGPPVRHALRRLDHKASSSLRPRQQRLEAPHFVVRGRVARRILLVDDVLTSGATLQAAAKALYRAGSDVVAAVVAARRA